MADMYGFNRLPGEVWFDLGWKYELWHITGRSVGVKKLRFLRFRPFFLDAQLFDEKSVYKVDFLCLLNIIYMQF